MQVLPKQCGGHAELIPIQDAKVPSQGTQPAASEGGNAVSETSKEANNASAASPQSQGKDLNQTPGENLAVVSLYSYTVLQNMHLS